MDTLFGFVSTLLAVIMVYSELEVGFQPNQANAVAWKRLDENKTTQILQHLSSTLSWVNFSATSLTCFHGRSCGPKASRRIWM